MRIAVALITLLFAGWMYAAENPPQQADGVEEELVPAQPEAPVDAPAQTDLILADINENPGADDADEDPRRFIPTEEISQDLGVSFPIDI